MKMEQPLTVQRVLDAPAECDHEITVRAVGPAVVIVIERDAPLRWEMLTSTSGEQDALREWLVSNPRAAHVWAAFLEAKEHEEGTSDPSRWRLEDAHAARLADAHPISTVRVTA